LKKIYASPGGADFIIFGALVSSGEDSGFNKSSVLDNQVARFPENMNTTRSGFVQLPKTTEYIFLSRTRKLNSL
jgi:hypothetical protein